MVRTALSSKVVTSAGYDPGEQRLELEFAGARVYEYFDVPPSVYDWLLRVADKGAFATRVIGPRYRYRELCADAEPPQDLERALVASLRALNDTST